MTPEVGKLYRYTKQPLSPAYRIVSIGKDGRAHATPEGTREVSAVFFTHMFDDLIPAEDKELN